GTAGAAAHGPPPRAARRPAQLGCDDVEVVDALRVGDCPERLSDLSDLAARLDGATERWELRSGRESASAAGGGHEPLHDEGLLAGEDPAAAAGNADDLRARVQGRLERHQLVVPLLERRHGAAPARELAAQTQL